MSRPISVQVCCVSRSRMTEAAWLAALAIESAEPLFSGARRAASAGARRLGVGVDRAPGDEQRLEAVERLARAAHRRLGIDGAGAQAAHEAQRRLGAFEIAAEPEQIVGRPARQIAEQPRDMRTSRGSAAARRCRRACRRAPTRRRIRRPRPSTPRARPACRRRGRSRRASPSSRPASPRHRRAARKGAARAFRSPSAAWWRAAPPPARRNRARAARWRSSAPRVRASASSEPTATRRFSSPRALSPKALAIEICSKLSSTRARSPRLAAPPGRDIGHLQRLGRSAARRGAAGRRASPAIR